MFVLFINYQNTESANAQRINDRENEKKGIMMKQREFFSQLQVRLFVLM